ncbi:MAG: DsbA family protein [Alphaproteobacteria bacterium]
MSEKNNKNVVLAVIVVAILAYLPFYTTRKAALDKAIENYVVENPKVIDASMRKFFGMPSLEEEKNLAEQAKSPEEHAKVINENKDALNSLDGAVILANPNGTVNMVEFMDFRCPFCKKNVDTMEKLAKEDSSLRWILKPLNPLGGTEAAEIMYAASLQDSSKLRALHDAIFQDGGHANRETLLKLAEGVGYDVKRLDKDMKSDAVRDMFNAAQKLFQALGGNGVPGIIIGETFIEGAYPEDTFLEAIAKAKGKK